jgi:hypothetical protein
VEKCCRAGEAADDSIKTAHALCVLDNYDYKRTFRIISYLLLFHGNSSYANAMLCYTYFACLV